MKKILVLVMFCLFSLTVVNASNHNHQGHCSHMMDKKEMKDNCSCKTSGECTCAAKGKECSCSVKKDSKEAKCGCGMTVKSCKAMMPSCEYRDAKEKSKNSF